MRTHNNPGFYTLVNRVGFEKLLQAVVETVVHENTTPHDINYFEKEGHFPNKCFTIRVTTPDEYKPGLMKINALLFESWHKREHKGVSVSEVVEDVLRKKKRTIALLQPVIIIPSPHDGSFEEGLRQLINEDKPFEVFYIDPSSPSGAQFYRFSNVLLGERQGVKL